MPATAMRSCDSRLLRELSTPENSLLHYCIRRAAFFDAAVASGGTPLAFANSFHHIDLQFAGRPPDG